MFRLRVRFSRRPHGDMQVLLNRELGEDPPVLRDIAYPRHGTLFWRRVEQIARRRARLIPDDAAAFDGHFPGDAIHEGGFPHPRQANDACTHPLRKI